MEVGQLNKKVVFVVQARTQSTRLPNKVLLPLPIGNTNNFITVIVNQLKKSKYQPTIYIATSINKEDNTIEEVCKVNNINIYRGSEEDVLSRFIEINKNFEVCVRLTGDNPIIDIDKLDETIQQHIKGNFDYSSTNWLPLGMNFEIINSNVILTLQKYPLTSSDKEHVTLYIKNSNIFNCNYITNELKSKYQDLRLTIDYPEDYLLVSTLINLSNLKNLQGLQLVDYVLKNYPWLLNTNLKNYQKKQYNNLKSEIIDAINILDKLEFKNVTTILNKYIENGI